MSESTDAAAVIAAINGQFNPDRVYLFGDPAVASLVTDYILVSVSRRWVPERRASGEVTLPGGRLFVRYAAKFADNISVLRERTKAAIEDQILPGDVGPFTFETADDVESDEGWFTSSDTFTY